ncbi:hypothetical protein [Salininema proteolyticum]|uniref:Uncharacterized protein n=1 Tax=Salininema proteolyticum TaxID=1607685 RepID=A0ABV8TV36_9ACTN
MPVLYLPPDTEDLGAIYHYGQRFEVRLDAGAGTAFLLYPASPDDDTPVAERTPAVIANCSRGVWAKITIYCDKQYRLSRTFTNWEHEIRDSIMLLVRRH